MGKGPGNPTFDVLWKAKGGQHLEFLAWILLGCLWGTQTGSFFFSFYQSYDKTEGITAIGLIKIANDFTSVVIVSGLVVGWHALCHPSAWMRTKMKMNIWGMIAPLWHHRTIAPRASQHNL